MPAIVYATLYVSASTQSLGVIVKVVCRPVPFLGSTSTSPAGAPLAPRGTDAVSRVYETEYVLMAPDSVRYTRSSRQL